MPVRVFTFLLLEIGHGLQFLGRHFLLIKVVVDPESNSNFSNFLDLTAEMVSTTIMVTGVRFVGTDFLAFLCCLSSLLSSDMTYTSSA